jgi:chaperonin GroEL
MIELDRKELFEKILNGIRKIDKAVASTFGPNGKNVIIKDLNGQIKVTKDGVTVANAIHSDDPIEQIAIEMIRQAANTSVENTGDGTSTTTLLASEMVLNNVNEFVALDVNQYKIDAAEVLNNVKVYLREKSIPVNESIIENVALTSSNNNIDIAKLVSKAVLFVGQDGAINVKINNNDTENKLEFVEGYSFKRGYESSKFINNPKTGNIDLQQTKVLIIDRKLDRFEDVLECVIDCKKTNFSLLIIAEEFSQNFINNCLKNPNIIPVKLPEFGTFRSFYLDDLSIYTGSKINNNKIDTSNMAVSDTVVVTKDSVSIVKYDRDKVLIDNRITLLKEHIKTAKDEFTKFKFLDRLHQLSSKNAIIYVGGNNPLEISETKDLIDDAVGACLSSLKQNVLPGAGKAMYKASFDYIKKGNLAETVILSALNRPMFILLGNSKGDYSNVSFNVGYDARRNEITNLLESGIIDSYETVINCIENAIAVSTSILCSECLIIQE